MGTQDVPLIHFRLDPDSGMPTYLQLVHQVEQALRLGYLQNGDKLPTVREVVESLAINPNTALKAYRELEHRGLAVGRPGQGTFIVGTLSKVGLREQTALRRKLLQWMGTAVAAGLDEQGMIALFNSALGELSDPGATSPTKGLAQMDSFRKDGNEGGLTAGAIA